MDNLNAQLLIPFLRNPGLFVSGASLGRQFRLSRVSVWNHLEQMKASGFSFTAVRNKGYRMDAEPLHLQTDLLDALLLMRPIPYFRQITCLDSTPSTNSAAESALSQGTVAPLAVLADKQSAGRGRRGRIWHSPAHQNLYLTIGLRPAIPPARLQSITLWTGLQLARLLRDQFGLPVQLKWPNDLILHGRKLAGILTEARIDAELTRELVIGIGINVNLPADELPPELTDLATSLRMAGFEPMSLSRFAYQILDCMADSLQQFFADDTSSKLARLWPELDYLAGKWVHSELAEGRATGITASGSLRIQRHDGSIALLHSGEVSVRLQ